MDIVIKDGNRIVNWDFHPETKLSYVFKKWEKDYYPVNRDTIRLNDRKILAAHLDCKIKYFAEKFDRMVFRVETIMPEKEEENENNPQVAHSANAV